MSTRVTVHDCYQQNYTYERTKRIGRDFDPVFTPDLTPQQMLAMGVFSGKYFGDKPAEFPASWWRSAKLPSDRQADDTLNFFGVHASQPLSVWRAKGWIHPDDPRGWFQWYCRYYVGRRHEDDARQIARWRAMRRHVAQIQKNCQKGDSDCRRRQRQALLHWAYDSRIL
jgi:hypothetical protein